MVLACNNYYCSVLIMIFYFSHFFYTLIGILLKEELSLCLHLFIHDVLKLQFMMVNKVTSLFKWCKLSLLGTLPSHESHTLSHLAGFLFSLHTCIPGHQLYCNGTDHDPWFAELRPCNLLFFIQEFWLQHLQDVGHHYTDFHPLSRSGNYLFLSLGFSTWIKIQNKEQV